MKTTKLLFNLFIGALILNTIFGCAREDVRPFAATEVFPTDTILTSISNKKAMIVLAHDDDMCGMTGTISMLNKNGWEIRVLSLSKGKSRNDAHQSACKNLLDSVLFFDVTETEFRFDSAEIEYDAIPKSQFNSVFNRPLVKQKLMAQVNAFNPAVLFTLDNDMGGYGHPEHTFISQLVFDLAQADSLKADFIYQNVYTDHMEKTIMERHARRLESWGFSGDGWEKAKAVYNVKGMPEPSVQIDIRAQAQEKMDFLKSYNDRERKTMGFFVPAFEEYSAEEYFNIFDREFFRIIEMTNQP